MWRMDHHLHLLELIVFPLLPLAGRLRVRLAARPMAIVSRHESAALGMQELEVAVGTGHEGQNKKEGGAHAGCGKELWLRVAAINARQSALYTHHTSVPH